MTKDLLGRALEDHFNSGKEILIEVSSDVSEVEHTPASYFFRSFEKMNSMEQLCMNSCSGRILDVGAGAGCHSLYLQNKGYSVMALERSSRLTKVMRQRGVQDVVCSSVSDFDSSHKFDTVICLMNGAGLAQRLDALPDFLKKLASHLTSTGEIYIDSSDISRLYADEDGTIQLNLTEGYHGDIHYHIDYKGESEDFPWVFPDITSMWHACAEANLDAELLLEVDGSFLMRLTKSS